MCWGFLRRRCLARDWGGVFCKLIASLRAKYPNRDYLLAVKGRRMTHTRCLAHLRRCLVVFGGISLSHSSAAVFTYRAMAGTALSTSGWCSTLSTIIGFLTTVPLGRGLHFLQLDAKGCSSIVASAPTHVFCACDSRGFLSRALGPHSPADVANMCDSLDVDSEARPTVSESESDPESALSSSFWRISQCKRELSHACMPSTDGCMMAMSSGAATRDFCACRHSGCCVSLQRESSIALIWLEPAIGSGCALDGVC